MALRSILRVGCLIVAIGVFVFDYKLTNANTNFFSMEAAVNNVLYQHQDHPREEQHSPCQIDSFLSPRVINRSHLITPLSGCHMAKWVYVYPIQRHLQVRTAYPQNIDNPPRMSTQRLHSADCLEEQPFKRLPVEPAAANHYLGKWDTVYVPFTRVEHFVTNLLPEIDDNKPIVVISGQWYLVNAVKDDTIQRLLDHSSVAAWFCQNLDVYAANFTRHPKVLPFPYGSFDAPFRHLYTKRKQFLEHVARVRQTESRRIAGLHLGYFGGTSTDRTGIPKGPKQPTVEYYDSLASSRYIFSPNGDRPECYRHFEAIGLGTIAITQMNPWTYRHLTGSVIFNNSDWNVTRWNSTTTAMPLLTDGGAVVLETPIADMIYQDYWKGYVEQQMNQTLNWDDDWTEVMSFVEK